MVRSRYLFSGFLAVALGFTCLTSASSLRAQTQTPGPPAVLGVPCASVSDLGIDKQTNLRAGMIMVGCGLAVGGRPEPAPQAGPGPLFGASAPTNVDVITGTETYPKVTQSESMVWSSDGQTIVVNYNDSSAAPSNVSGVSVSTDGGTTFRRILPAPFATGHGTNFGDPVVVFNAALGEWFAGDIVTGCGGQGIGLWTSSDGQNWTPGACAHRGDNDDRDSTWVDNNPASPGEDFYVRSHALLALGGTGLRVTAHLLRDALSASESTERQAAEAGLRLLARHVGPGILRILRETERDDSRRAVLDRVLGGLNEQQPKRRPPRQTAARKRARTGR